MRSLRWPVVAAFAGIVACNVVEQGMGGGGGGGFGTDAGASTDAGTGRGGTDAGTTSGADAGTTSGADAGTVGTGNTDAGTTVSDGTGLAPAALGPMRAYEATYDSRDGMCGYASASGGGTVALLRANDQHPAWAYITSSGDLKTSAALWRGQVLAQPGDFLAVSGGTNDDMTIWATDDGARAKGTISRFEGGEPIVIPDPQGGVAVTGAIAAAGVPGLSRGPYPLQLMAGNEDGTIRFGPRRLALNSAVFGMGVDLNRRILLVQDGFSICGGGCIVGQWYGADGNPATGTFTMIEHLVPGPATWFEMAPLIGGGLAVRRMDAKASGNLRGFTSTWLMTVESGCATIRPPPDWMTSRPNTDLAVARNKRAYAVLPNGQDGERCTQRLELVSASGNACGSWDLTMAGSGSCDNWALRLGLDGTVLQRLPAQLERYLDSANRGRTCTVRFWPAALK